MIFGKGETEIFLGFFRENSSGNDAGNFGGKYVGIILGNNTVECSFGKY